MNKKILYPVLCFLVFALIIFIFLKVKVKEAQSDKNLNFGVVEMSNLQSKNLNNRQDSLELGDSCPVKIEERTVRGNSMTPFLKSGEVVQVDFNFYNCGKKPQRDDVIISDFQAQDLHLIKIIKTVPGDKFEVNKKDKTLIVNNKEVENMEGKIYRFTNQNIKMLSLYEKSFNGIMKEDMYFIFGDRAGGTDSGKFGAIQLKNILGKVILN